jgi:cytochrome P450
VSRGWRLLGDLAGFRRDPLGFFTERARAGDVVPVRLVTRGFLVNHPDYVKHVLQDNHTNYGKGPLYSRLKPAIGEGLVTSEGEVWRRQRRLAQPTFSRERIASFATAMTERTGAMLDRWAAPAGRGAPLDVHAEMMKLTLAILGDTVFGRDLSRESDALTQAVTTAIEITNRRVYSLVPVPLSWPTPENRRYRRALATLDDIVHDMIAKKRAAPAASNDLLSMLMTARDDETGERMSDQQLRDEAMTMLIAGHETTALVLSFTWYLLSRHPDVERKLHDEVARVLGDRRPTSEDVPRLAYTTLVIHEVMRLYPPAWFIARRAINDDAIGPQRIPAGSAVLMVPYLTHRHPTYWENPEAFDPERFMPERVAGRPRFAYFPFAGGPRQCIGNNFAMMEAVLIAAMIVQRYRLHLVPGHRLELDASITLRPRHGMPMTLERTDVSSLQPMGTR